MIKTLGGTPRGRQSGQRDERLNLDEEWAVPIENGGHHRAGYAGAAVCEKELACVRHGAKPITLHLEQAEFVGGAEAVL